MPLSFFRTAGNISIMWMYGYVIVGKNTYDTFSLAFTVMYYYTIVLICINVAMITRSEKNLWIIIDAIVDLVLYIFCVFLWYKYGCDSGYPYYWLASIYFIVPIVAIPLFILSFLKKKNPKLENIQATIKYNEATDVLLAV